jgi:TATA-box binding protein (TBP) (component of TFIID and TFIIIB)
MFLKRPHRVVQEQQNHAAAAFLHLLTRFEDNAPPPPSSLPSATPLGGWVRPEAEQWSHDPLSLRRTEHDVIPKEVLDDADPTNTFRDGSARDAFRIGKSIEAALAAKGLLHAKGNIHERFTVTDAAGANPMEVHVCNIVHMSDCSVLRHPQPLPAPPILPPQGKKKKDKENERPVLSHLWMWRHLLHLGPQMNNINTSLKISYMGPHKATALIFERFNYLETGSKHFDVGEILFGATLHFFQAAGIPHLHVQKRQCHNLVATSEMPGGQGLNLDLLTWRLAGHLQGEIAIPESFPGIIVPHPNAARFPKFKILLFRKGPVVWVGGKTKAEMQAAAMEFYPILLQNLDTPANRQAYQQLLDQGQITPLLLLPLTGPGTAAAAKSKNKKNKKTANKRQPQLAPKRKRGM